MTPRKVTAVLRARLNEALARERDVTIVMFPQPLSPKGVNVHCDIEYLEDLDDAEDATIGVDQQPITIEIDVIGKKTDFDRVQQIAEDIRSKLDLQKDNIHVDGSRFSTDGLNFEPDEDEYILAVVFNGWFSLTE